MNTATAFAPATIGNVGVGFDLMGLCLDAGVGDTVTLTKRNTPTVQIQAIETTDGTPIDLPTDPQKNTATAGLLALIHDLDLAFGFDVFIKKGISLGSGMGGSAASAAGAIVAANVLLDTPLTSTQCFHYALIGETQASGAAHGDNLAPCLFGGLQLITNTSPLQWTALPTPPGLYCVLVHPHMRLDTKKARSVLNQPFALKTIVQQSTYLASFISACYTQDVDLLASSLKDVLIEPHRKGLIPGFEQVQQAAYEHGALGCTISGAGPSMFAICKDQTQARTIQSAMMSAFLEHGQMASDGYISLLDAPGARLLPTTV